MVGAGPVGLTTAIDLAQCGIKVVVLDDDDNLSIGSRAICFAKRTLEIFDRLGCGQPMLEKGIVLELGKVFFRDEQVYQFNLLPEGGHKLPAFINLQQYYVEEYPGRPGRRRWSDLRWKHNVVARRRSTPTASSRGRNAGRHLCADVRLPARLRRREQSVREHGRAGARGQVVSRSVPDLRCQMHADFPTERWFWFDPPFHPQHSVLLHRQPDNVWRIDFQLGWDADPDEEKKPEREIPRIHAMLGRKRDSTFEWASVYTFAVCAWISFRTAA